MDSPSEGEGEIEAASDATQESPKQCSDLIVDVPNSPTPTPTPKPTLICKIITEVLDLCKLIPMVLVWDFIITALCTVPLLVMLVLLSVSFVALTFVQLFWHGHLYDKAAQLKSIIRFLIFSTVSYITRTAILFSYTIYLKHTIFMGLSLFDWISSVLPTLSEVCLCSFLVNLLLHLVPPIPLGYNESGVSFREAIFEIFDCIWFLIGEAVLIKRVSSLKKHETLGLHTWKWITVLILVVIGVNVVRLCTHLCVWLTRKVITEKLDPAKITHLQHKLFVEKMLPREYLVYYATGLKNSIVLILGALLILFTWVFYFVPRLNETPHSDKIKRFGTRTSLCFLIFSFLWLVKIWVVLSWEATAMYSRLRSKIVDLGSQLYFLGIIARHDHDFLNITYYGHKQKPIDLTSESTCNNFISRFDEFLDNHIDGQVMSYPTSKMVGFGRMWEVTFIYLNMIIDMTSPNFSSRSTRDKVEEDDLGEIKDNKNQVRKQSAKMRKTTKYDLLIRNRTLSVHDIKQVAEYFISANTALSKQNFVSSILDKLTADTSDISGKLKQLIDEKSNLNTAISDPSASPVVPRDDASVTQGISTSPTVEHLNKSCSTDQVHTVTEDPATLNDWQYFMELVQINGDFSEHLFRTWLEETHSNCMFLANALSSTKDVVECLNTIVSCFLIGATFISWLLLIDFATTTVLVLIASPLFAATFIFGDTCKTLFQGFIYVYVVHPLHAGDLCCVDENKLVVKSVGIWRTTFCKVENLGTREEVSYPNSELSMKVVIKHLNEIVLDDSLEITLGSLHRPFVKDLKNNIDAFFNDLKKEDKSMSCSHCVEEVQEEGKDLKMIIKLKYKITKIEDYSYFKYVCRNNLKVVVDKFLLSVEEEQNPPELSAAA